ncbi:hypothetical protein MRY82_02105 [bacterium]|nr:hypothetical protein [bacterium]
MKYQYKLRFFYCVTLFICLSVAFSQEGRMIWVFNSKYSEQSLISDDPTYKSSVLLSRAFELMHTVPRIKLSSPSAFGLIAYPGYSVENSYGYRKYKSLEKLLYFLIVNNQESKTLEAALSVVQKYGIPASISFDNDEYKWLTNQCDFFLNNHFSNSIEFFRFKDALSVNELEDLSLSYLSEDYLVNNSIQEEGYSRKMQYALIGELHQRVQYYSVKQYKKWIPYRYVRTSLTYYPSKKELIELLPIHEPILIFNKQNEQSQSHMNVSLAQENNSLYLMEIDIPYTIFKTLNVLSGIEKISDKNQKQQSFQAYKILCERIKNDFR